MRSYQRIRVTKSFEFEMAHALAGYDGDCSNIHGHSYKLQVTLRGVPMQYPGHPKDGMVLDFRDLKKTVHEKVLDRFDHALALNNSAPSRVSSLLTHHFEKVVLLPFQPTCENLVLDIVESIRNDLPPDVELFRVKLHETSTAYAEWCSEDEV